jgi:transposase-like protein
MALDIQPDSLLEATRYYADLDRCQALLVQARWPNGVVCPTCGASGNKIGYLAAQRRWQCYNRHPRRQFSVKVGTIFEDSPITLDKWFVAIWLITAAKNGVSSYEIHRSIKVTQKTAWFMLHRIRLAMACGSFDKKLTGEVEIDETYVGGKLSNMHKHRQERVRSQSRGRWAGKVAVMGLLDRHGNDGTSQVRTRIVQGTKRKELYGVICENVADQSNIYTDALPSYASMNSRFVHEFIDHSEAYVRERVHTNGLENFWSLLKRAVKGTYVAVDPMHLFRYVDEQAFRFTKRKGTDASRFAEALLSVTGRRITYKEWIGAAEPA